MIITASHQIWLLIAITCCIVQESFCFGRSEHQNLLLFGSHKPSAVKSGYTSRILKKSPFKSLIATSLSDSVSSDVTVVPTSSTSSSHIKDLLAKLAGYVMGAGAMVVYTPILITLLKRGNAVGFSIATWVYTLIGMLTAIAYPMKKGFPISTYLEVVGAAVQSLVILGVICFYDAKMQEFAIGVTALAVVFGTFLKVKDIPPHLLGLVQIAASLVANYANVPQILLTFQTKKASWSGITAFLSIAGCLIRILTTIQLTKDPFVIAGYVLGVVTNGILFAQVIIYK